MSYRKLSPGNGNASPVSAATAVSLLLASGFALLGGAVIVLDRFSATASLNNWIIFLSTASALLAFGMSGAAMNPLRFSGRSADRSEFADAAITGMILVGGGLWITAPGLAYQDDKLALAILAGSVLGLAFGAYGVAPRMKRAGVQSIPALLAFERRSASAIALAAIAGAITCMGLALAQASLSTHLIRALTGIDSSAAATIAVSLAALPIWLGGERALRRIASLGYMIVFTGFMFPLAVFISRYGASLFTPDEPASFIFPRPPGDTGSLLGDLAARHFPITQAGISGTMAAVLAGFAAFAVTACLPVFQHRLAASSLAEGPGRFLTRSLLLAAALIAVSPIYVNLVLSYLEVTLVGETADTLSANNGWIFSPALAELGPAFTLCGKPAASQQSVTEACAAAGGTLSQGDIRIDGASAVLLTPFIDDLAGAFASIFLTALLAGSTVGLATLLNAASRSLGEDLLGTAFHPGASEGEKASRVRIATLLSAVAIAFGVLASDGKPAAYGLWFGGAAAAALFPALVLTIMRNSVTGTSLAAGMAAGLVTAFAPAIVAMDRFRSLVPSGRGWAEWIKGLDPASSVILAIGANLAVILAVQLIGQMARRQAHERKETL